MSALTAERGGLVRELLRSRGLQLIGVALVAGGLAWAWLDAGGGLAALRERHGVAAALILVPLQTLVSATPFPGEIVALANGLVLGFWWGSAAIWVGWMGTAYLQYWLVRRAADDLNLEVMLEKLPRWARRFPVDHPIFLICVRWLPYGPHVVNTAAGAFRVPAWRFGWCAAIGIGVGAFVVSGLANGWTLF